MFKIADYKIGSINTNPRDLIPKQVKYINAEKLWKLGFTGKGIKVGVIDTGCTDHHCLNSKIVKGKNFTKEGTPDNYIDLNGHGSHVASIIGAKPDGIHPGIYGVAYDCELYI